MSNTAHHMSARSGHILRIRALLHELEALPASEHETLRVAFLCWHELAGLIGRNNEARVLHAWQSLEVAEERQQLKDEIPGHERFTD